MMDDPLLGNRAYVADFDADTHALTLRANTPGPAGALLVEFDGLTVAFDAADPRQLSFIDIADGRSALSQSNGASLLQRLVGDGLTERLVSLIASGKRPRPLRIDDSSRGNDAERVPERAARLAVALTGAESPGLLTAEAAFATLEALVIAHELGLADDLPDSADRLVGAATTVAALSPLRLPAYGITSRMLAAEVAEQAARWLPQPLGDSLRAVVPHVRTDEPPLAAAMVRPTAAAPAAPPAPEPRAFFTPRPAIAISPESLPLAIAHRMPTIVRTSNDEYELRLAGWSERALGWWVRAFTVGEQVPLAVVPMLAHGRDAVAQLLLPPNERVDFELDIVDSPGSLRPSPRVAAFRAAIASGQRAARLERLDRPDEAAEAWRRSSRFHHSAGDSDRSRQAEALVFGQRAASRQRTQPKMSPTVSDHFLPTG